jgi:two-component system phosphate regulon sensor histidine kinase PhoR
VQELESLATLLLRDRDHLLALWRKQVRSLASAAKLDVPTLNDHLPALIIELADALRAHMIDPDGAGADSSPPAHGLQRFEVGFDIEEVVAEYNMLRECIHDMAGREGITLQGPPFHILNRVLDNAIGLAVKTYAAHQALEVQRRREEYLAFVMHDLRTPLNAISLVTRVLELRMPAAEVPAEVATMLKSLRRNVNHLDELVGTVLKENTHLLTELAIKVERRTFDLWPLVEMLIRDLEPMAGKSATRIVNRVPPDLSMRADAGLVRRIFQNLLINAVEYTPGGEVVVTARQAEPDGPVECIVSDNGAGIPADRLDKVFDMGETNPERDGTGLGLAIVRTFVEAHDGEMSVESTEGRGSTFRFTVPPAAVKAPVPRTAATPVG